MLSLYGLPGNWPPTDERDSGYGSDDRWAVPLWPSGLSPPSIAPTALPWITPNGWAPAPPSTVINSSPNSPSLTSNRGLFGDYFASRSLVDGSGGILPNLTETNGYSALSRDTLAPSPAELFQTPFFAPGPTASNAAVDGFATPAQRPASAPSFSPSALTTAPEDASPPTSDGAIISDANPAPWIADAQYAQARGGRGSRRVGEREPSPLEQVRRTIYNHNFDVLRELDPKNQRLFAWTTRDWEPSQRDIQILKNEIFRVRQQRGGWDPEPHHNLALQFERDFLRCGLDPEDFVTYVSRDLHRIRPHGLHTGPSSWNPQWRDFFLERATGKTSMDDVLRQLIKMWENASWLRR
jgi:hypothetical protein